MRTIPVNKSETQPGPVNSPDNGAVTTPIKLVEASLTYQEPLICAVYGGPGSGKSRLAGTAPGDIGCIPMEHKSRMSITRAAAQFGRKVILPDIDLVRSARGQLIETMPSQCITPEMIKREVRAAMKDEDAEKTAERQMEKKTDAIPLDGKQPACCQRCYYRWFANRTKSVAYRMAEMDSIKTIVIDPFGQFVDDMLFANYGRNEKIMPLDRKSFNREVIDFLNSICHKHVILTHHSDQVWKDNKPTTKTKPRNSFSKLGHFLSVVIELVRDDDADASRGESTFQMLVKDCQPNVALIDHRTPLLVDGDITFQQLAVAVYPDADPEGWE